MYCEHSFLPVHDLDRSKPGAGTYILDIPRDWFVKAAPVIRFAAALIKPLLGVGPPAVELDLNEADWNAVKEQLTLGKESLTAASDAGPYLAHDGKAEIRDAAKLWGLDAKETQAALEAETGDPRVRAVCIGPSGEKTGHVARPSPAVSGVGSPDARPVAAWIGRLQIAAVVGSSLQATWRASAEKLGLRGTSARTAVAASAGPVTVRPPSPSGRR